MHGFKDLIKIIQDTHQQFQSYAVQTVNKSLTIRNWLIGYYIVEYEQNGSDKAKYGEYLINNLAEKLVGIRGVDCRSLYRFRQFYLLYPHLMDEIIYFINDIQKVVSASPQSQLLVQKVGTASPQLELLVPAKDILNKLSYSHIELLISIEDQLKRTFYEIESIKAVWSVKELRRQINSLYYERTGLSKNPDKLTALNRKRTKPQQAGDVIKNVYTFDFLNLSY